MADSDLKAVFEQYAAFGRSGQLKDTCTITGKNFSKLIKEKNLLDKKLNTTEVDMIFTRAKAKGTIVLNYDQFVTALTLVAESKYGSKSDFDKIKSKITSGGGPSTAGTTTTAAVGGVDRMTDTSKYTGSHKQRFDESGKGKGLEGRKDLPKTTGYVGNYKGEGTYDKKH